MRRGVLTRPVMTLTPFTCFQKVETSGILTLVEISLKHLSRNKVLVVFIGFFLV